MPVELSIVETVTELETTVVEVVLDSSSAPGIPGPGVPTGGTDGQVLTKTSATDYETAWEDPTGGGGGGAPVDATYLVTTADGDLTAEVVVGATPGGELGGTWASPTVDASHSGSTHAAVQAAAEATAAAALSSHEGDTTSVHGIADTSALALTANHPSNATFNDHSARHENGGADEISIAGLDGTSTELAAHLADAADAHDASAISIADAGNDFTATDVEGALAELQADHEADVTALTDHAADTTSIHGIADTSALALSANVPSNATFNDHSARHENGGADEISLAGLDGTPSALQTHLDDTSDAHDASAISVADAAGDYTATDVEGVLAEIAPQLGGTPTFVGARVRRTTAQTISDSTLTAIGFDAERFDSDGFHDNSTNNTRLTVPSGMGGKYLIGGSASFVSGGASTFRQFSIRLNGSDTICVCGGDISAINGPFRESPVTLYDLAAGDYVELMAFQSTGASRDVESTAAFSPEFWITKLG